MQLCSTSSLMSDCKIAKYASDALAAWSADVCVADRCGAAGVVCAVASQPPDDEEKSAPGVPLRVERLLANLGYGKRRECATLIKQGRVVFAATGASAKVGQKAVAGELLLDGEPLDPPAPLVLLLHKPVGYVVTSPDDENILDPKVYDLLPYRFGRRRPFMAAVGRLDKETSGLLLLTDDGQLLHRIMSPRSSIWKRYRAVLDKPLTGKEAAAAVRRFAGGAMQLVGDRGPLLPAGLTMLDEVTAEVALSEGRYHQIRRMFGLLGYEVQSLHRYAVGGLQLDDLQEGDWRFATQEDLTALFGGPQLDPAAAAAGDGKRDSGSSSSSSSSSVADAVPNGDGRPSALAAGIHVNIASKASSSGSSSTSISSSRSSRGSSSSSSSGGALAAGQVGEELLLDDVEDPDGLLQLEQSSTSKRYRDSTRFRRRRVLLKQRLAAAQSGQEDSQAPR